MKKYYIPKNVMSNKKILGFKPLNLIEGIAEILVLAVLIALTPFVARIRLTVLLCLSIFIMIINFIGIQGNSIMQTFYYVYKYKKQVKKQYSFRRFRHGVKRDAEELIVNGKFEAIKENVSISRIRNFFGL